MVLPLGHVICIVVLPLGHDLICIVVLYFGSASGSWSNLSNLYCGSASGSWSNLYCGLGHDLICLIGSASGSWSNLYCGQFLSNLYCGSASGSCEIPLLCFCLWVLGLDINIKSNRYIYYLVNGTMGHNII